MDLRDYPRPKDDTGIGVHWNAGFAAAIGLGQIEQIWLPRLREMGIKWVKIADHDGALGFAELLLKNDIMPIVRIYRPQPNPGTLGPRELAAVSDFMAAGVRYFEFNNEPDMGVEWRGGEVPLDALTIVARNAITDMEAILQRGGYPGIPAVLPGSRWNLVGEICRLGRRDLLAQPVWQAIHNYSANHPLDYPYDRVNQEGAPCSRELYNKLALERWNGDAWEGWTLEQVNRFRQERANPGATAISDPTCWRGYERFDYLIRREIGRSLPILATENGYVVGERPDKRYPATTPQLHAIQTLEACRIMMGTSRLFEPAPDYYFCTAFWLLGNFMLGSWAPAWENAAWFSHNWPDGRLPIVNALMAEPKQARVWRGDGAQQPGRLTGVIRRGPAFPLTLRLVRADGWLAVVQSSPDGRFEFADLPYDRFVLSIVEAGVSQEVVLTEEEPAAAADFDLSGVTVRLANGSIAGKVRGGAGKVVLLTRETGHPYEEKQLIAPDNTYRFSELEPGMYTIRLADTSVVKAGIAVDGQHEVTVDLAVPGWGWQASDGGASPGFGIVRVRVTGRLGLPVRLWTAGWSGMVQRTGSKPEYGPDACEFAPLGSGRYKVQPEGIPTIAEIDVDGGRVLWVTFAETVSAPVAPPRESVVSGHVRTAAGAGAAGRQVTLWGPEAEQTTTTQEDGAYRFEHLGPGVYRIGVAGTEVMKEKIELDGHNAVTVDLELPAPAGSTIFGVVTHGAGRTVRLLLPAIAEPLAVTPVDAAGRYRFERLAAGTYTVQVLEPPPSTAVAAEKAGVTVDGVQEVQIDFALAEAAQADWSVKIEPGDPSPGFAVVRCQVEGEIGREVRLWTVGWSGMVQRTGSKPEYGPDACEFAPLGPGRYYIEPVGLATDAAPDLRAELVVEPQRVLWVRYRRIEPPPAVEPPAPAEPPRRSVIAGRVKGGAGRTIKLEAADFSRTTIVAADETYRFADLPAGVYTLTVLDNEPPTGLTASQADIRVDGQSTAEVDLDLTALEPAKTLDHYLLVGSSARGKDDFVTTLQYVSRFRPVVGTDEAEARKARHVTILGSLSAVGALVEQGLRMAGCHVQRIEGDYAAALGRLLAEDRPY